MHHMGCVRTNFVYLVPFAGIILNRFDGYNLSPEIGAPQLISAKIVEIARDWLNSFIVSFLIICVNCELKYRYEEN